VEKHGPRGVIFVSWHGVFCMSLKKETEIKILPSPQKRDLGFGVQIRFQTYFTSLIKVQ